MTPPLWVLKFWHGLQAVGTWIKGHWLLVLLAAVIAYAFVFAKNKTDTLNQLLKEFQDQQTQNAKQMEELRKIQQDQITKQLEINRKYDEVIDRIQRDYRDQLHNLDVQKEADLRHIITVNHDDPIAMARDINTLFGIPLMETTPRSHI